MTLQWKYSFILLTSITPIIIYVAGWYSLPLAIFVFLQNSLLKRTRFGGYDTDNVPE